jgi:hypothetical protein
MIPLRARELEDSHGQSGRARRALLTGGAAGLAAVAATTLGGGQTASAATTTEPSITDWLNVMNPPYMATGTGTTDDTKAIQAALDAAAPGQVVYLPRGKYLISAPLVIQTNGVTLRGCHGATASGNDASLDLGSVLVLSSTFTNSNSWSSLVTGAIVIIQLNPGAGQGTMANPSSNQVSGVRLFDFWIDGSGSSDVVDGVACFGAIEAWQAERVGCYSIKGKAFPQYTDHSWTTGGFPDGQHMYSCVAQTCHDHAFYGNYIDATLIDCHAQNSNETGSGYGDGFYLNGANNRLIACRSDLSANGFTIDVPTGGGGFYDCITLIGCGTQGNTNYGLNVINSSDTGQRAPVIVVGCSFDQDGVSSVYASGSNLVELSACSLMSGSHFFASGSPASSITCAAPGGGQPTVIMNGGRLNPVTQVLSGAADANLLRINDAISAVGVGATATSYKRYQYPANAASFSSSPNAPAGTTSTTLVMMGLGGTWAFTPTGTGLVQVNVTGFGNTQTGLTFFQVGARYGTDSAPTNGTAVTGTRFGSAGDPQIEGSGTGKQAGLAFTSILTLTPGTAYWFDLALATGDASDTAVFADLSISIIELAQ